MSSGAKADLMRRWNAQAGQYGARGRGPAAGRGMTGQITHKGEKAPSRPGSAGPPSARTPGTSVTFGGARGHENARSAA